MPIDQPEWFSEPGNKYGYTCLCGHTTRVSIPQAGSSLDCSCGRLLNVPTLSRLRVLAGKDGYEAGVVDEIKRLIRNGSLPSVGVCAVSKRPTGDAVMLRITVPRFFKDQDGNDYKIMMLFGWIAVLLVNIFRKPEFEEEGAMTFDVPLLVSAARQAKARGFGQARLQKLVQIEPLYARLLEENPHCRIAVLD